MLRTSSIPPLPSLPRAQGHAHGDAGGTADNINVRAAYIHVLGDLLQSIGVMIAAIIIWVVPSAHIADPICTFVFAIMVLYTTVGVVRDALRSLLNSVPDGIDLGSLVRDFQAIEGVSNVHDLHVWSFGSAGDASTVSLTVHLAADEPASVLTRARAVALAHGVAHPTIQVEQCGSRDIAECGAARGGCDLDVYGANSAPLTSLWQDVVSAVLGRSPAAPPADGMLPLLRVRGPAHDAEHHTSSGGRHAITPRRVAAGACDGHGHAHGDSHASDHGHVHGGAAGGGGGHGHAHGSGAAGGRHGHAHGAVTPVEPALPSADGAALAAMMGIPASPSVAGRSSPGRSPRAS